MKAGHGLNSTRLTAGAFANAFGSDALLRRSGHRHAGAGGGSLGRKRRVPALPFEGAPLLHLDPPYLEVPVVPQAVFTQGLARSSRIRRSVLTVSDCHPDGGQRRTAGRLVQAAPVAGGQLKPPRSSCWAAFAWRWTPERPRAIGVRRFIRLLTDIGAVPGGTQSRDLRTGSGAAAVAPAHYGRDEGREVARGFYGPDHPVQP